MELQVRPAAEEDAAALADLQCRSIRQSLAGDYPESVIDAFARSVSVERFLAPRSPCIRLLAVRDGAILGFGTLFLDGAVGGMYVDPAHQGRGIGGRLLKHLEAEARRCGLVRLRLESTITAESFYAHRGYRAGQRISHELPTASGTGMPVVPMYKTLEP